MPFFKAGRKPIPFRGATFTVREMTAAERDTAKATSTKLDVPFLNQVVFQQTEWPEDMKPVSVHVLAEEPFELLEKLADGIFGMSGMMESEADTEKKAG